MVRVKIPVGVDAVVLIVSVELPEVVIDVGTKLLVVLAGNPVTDRLTVPVYPLVGATVTVVLADPPWVTDPDEVGFALIVKSGVGAAVVPL